jgi:Xaa-Pro aminopeptidase
MATTEERDRRYAALRAMMDEEGYDCLLMSGNAEATQAGYVRYLSDWRLWGGKGFGLLFKDRAPILVLGTGSQSYWSAQVSWVEDVHAAQDMLAEVVAVIEAMGAKEGSIGVAGLNHVMTHGDVQRLNGLLPTAELVDATRPVDDIMAIKSVEELEMMAETSRYLIEAHEVLAANFAPGRTERDVMAAAVQHLAARGCHDGIAHLTNGILPYFRPPTDRVIEEEDSFNVSLEFAGPNGYWIELAGVYGFREPDPRRLHYFESSINAIRQVEKMLRPGVTGGDVTRTVEAAFRKDGWNVTGRGIWDGHGIGLNVIRPPYGVIDNADVFRENMVFNVHPGLMVDEDGLGMFLQDNLVVTPEGGKPLVDYLYTWRVLPV